MLVDKERSSGKDVKAQKRCMQQNNLYLLSIMSTEYVEYATIAIEIEHIVLKLFRRDNSEWNSLEWGEIYIIILWFMNTNYV